MGKTTKLNPVRQTDGVKNHVTHSLSKHKIFNLTAMPMGGRPGRKNMKYRISPPDRPSGRTVRTGTGRE